MDHVLLVYVEDGKLRVKSFIDATSAYRWNDLKGLARKSHPINKRWAIVAPDGTVLDSADLAWN